MEVMDEQDSPGADRPLNTITVVGRELLLVAVGSGAGIHLALEYADGEGIAIQVDGIPGDHEDPALWEQKTLCGRSWQDMAPGADDPTLLWQDAAYAPTCRACLRVVDTWFPKSTAPAGVALLAEVVADAVVSRSSTYVTGVPGEHLEATRRAIRKALRDRGFNSNTHVVDDLLAVWSDDAYQTIDRDEIGRRVTAALERVAGGPDGTDLSDAGGPAGRVDWNTWVTES